MPFIAASCERCDAPLKYDIKSRKWYCEYCDYPHEKDNTIHQYTTKIDSLHLDGVWFDAEMTTEMKMELNAAEAHMKMQNYEEARNRFARLSIHIPQDYRVWWGQIRAISREFDAKLENRRTLTELHELFEKTMLFAGEQEKEIMERQFMDYYNPLMKNSKRSIDAKLERVNELEAELGSIRTSIQELEQEEVHQLRHFPMELLPILILVVVIGFAKDSVFLWGGVPAGVALWELLFLPFNEYLSAQWDEQRKSAIEELSQQRERVERDLAEINEQLSKLEG